MAHWPEVVRKVAAQLKGLVEGVLKKKTMMLVDRDDSEPVTGQAADNDSCL